MSRPDADLMAVRDLPPGVVEPSDEAVARVWQRIAARPVPAVRRRSLLRIWLPVVAAAAVVLLVAAGLGVFRPHARTLPAGPRFTSDPAVVAEVFAGLIAAAETAEPFRLRDGQLIYRHDDRITTRTGAPQPVRVDLESWFRPDMEQVHASFAPQPPGFEPLARARAEESAQHPRPAGPDTRPWAGVRLDAPSDPTVTLQGILEPYPPDDSRSEQRRRWDEVVWAAGVDPFLPTAWRSPLYRLLARLTVSVAETEVSGRPLVVARFSEGTEARDLFLDPSTGRFAGAQLTHIGSGSPSPRSGETLDDGILPFLLTNKDSIPAEPVEPGEVGPGLLDRSLWTWAVVEEVGDRP